MCTIGKRGESRHINLETDKKEYANAMSFINRLRDIRKLDDDEIICYVRSIPRMERYAEIHRLCLWCFNE